MPQIFYLFINAIKGLFTNHKDGSGITFSSILLSTGALLLIAPVMVFFIIMIKKLSGAYLLLLILYGSISIGVGSIFILLGTILSLIKKYKTRNEAKKTETATGL